MTPALRGSTLTAQARLPDGRQVLTLIIDRAGLGNLLDRPEAFALLPLDDLLGHGPFTLLLLTGEPTDAGLEARVRSLLSALSQGTLTPGNATASWTSPTPEDRETR